MAHRSGWDAWQGGDGTVSCLGRPVHRWSVAGLEGGCQYSLQARGTGKPLGPLLSSTSISGALFCCGVFFVAKGPKNSRLFYMCVSKMIQVLHEFVRRERGSAEHSMRASKYTALSLSLRGNRSSNSKYLFSCYYLLPPVLGAGHTAGHQWKYPCSPGSLSSRGRCEEL